MFPWQIRGRVLPIATRPLVMGIVNVTPDSFSDGGQYASPERAIAHGLELERQGADILDVGGPSRKRQKTACATGRRHKADLVLILRHRSGRRAK